MDPDDIKKIAIVIGAIILVLIILVVSIILIVESRKHQQVLDPVTFHEAIRMISKTHF